MDGLRNHSWSPIYESRPGTESTFLVDEFYVPALKRSIRYDRVAGYFSSTALAVASRGIDALLEHGGEMRLIVGTDLYKSDKPVLERLTDELEDSLEELEDEELDAHLKLLARLLREERLHIKVAVPREGNWQVFHPKMGIFHDEEDNALSFEGSVNETIGGWKKNYERFKVHRSWEAGEDNYVDADITTFGQLWSNQHPFVEVYDLPEAIERELIDWKDPDSESEIEEAIQIARGEAPPTEADKANIIADGQLAPGGLALAEGASTITPWPHQRVVSDTLVNTYPNSFLLCDEVGLGKTIEAGLTLSRLGLTEELETGLLLVPASLTQQWQEELWEKFNINAYRFDRNTANEYVFFDAFDQSHGPPSRSECEIPETEEEQAWVDSPIWRFIHEQQKKSDPDTPSTPTIVLMSWHTARLQDRWNQVAPRDSGQIRTRDEVPKSCRGRSPERREGVWDAVIIDEAHNAREGSSFYTMLERLRDHTQCYYFLTATPMQLHAGELHDLMTLLDLPDRWDNQESFVEFFETRQTLSQAIRTVVDSDGSEGSTPESWSSQATLDEQRYQDRLPTDRSISDRVFDEVANILEVGDNRSQARSIAKQRVLEACSLASNYGEHYDGYVERFDEALEEHDVDPFDAKEDEKLKYLLYPTWKAEEEWLTYDRNDRLNALDDLSESGWQVVEDVLSESTPVDALIHRNTRDTLRKYEKVGLLDETVPDRNPKQRQIELTDETRRVYDRIDDYTRKFYKLAQQSDEAETRAIGFVMTTYRQRLTSSIYAISQSLQNRLEKLRGQRAVLKGKQQAAKRARENPYGEETSTQILLETVSDQDLDDLDALDDLDGGLEDVNLSEIIPNVTEQGIGLLEQEIEELESFVNNLKHINKDPKIDQLIDDLNELDRGGHNRVIIFTQYADTMDFIRNSLTSIHSETVATYSGRGGEMWNAYEQSWVSVGKERVKREFAADEGKVEILVCTDSASEGLNLQECGALINYDLPWNPMRVEQRIGRIDRIGQRYSEVQILNYSYKDTVETDIYERLNSRIDLFENVVGEMQPVLSGVSRQIRTATLETERNQSREAVAEADREFSERLKEQEQSNRVDVGESLDEVESLVAQDVIDEAKLEAWKSAAHPDLDEVGDENYRYPSPYDTSSLEKILVGSEALSDAGVVFTPVAEVEIDVTDSDYADQFDFGETTYRLAWDGMIIPEPDGEQTFAQVIAPGEDEVAVTFSADCADEYPSVHYLAPGNPLLGQLVETLREETDERERLLRKARYRETSEVRPLVCGWGRDGTLGRLKKTDDVIEDLEIDLDTWVSMFLQNREEVIST
ncbi:SNF2-related protein [Halorubrum miltondacostae]|uniref:Helicase-related protein n=1 Tax=Halorubrum miltondacostae TaxID=3076378 RepID=A0ABD5M7T0_9EURY